MPRLRSRDKGERKMEIIQRIESRFKDIDVRKYDFISHRPDGSIIDFKGIAVKFDMKNSNSVNDRFFDVMRKEGLEIYNMLVLPSGPTPMIEYRLYYKKETLKTIEEKKEYIYLYVEPSKGAELEFVGCILMEHKHRIDLQYIVDVQEDDAIPRLYISTEPPKEDAE